MDLIFAPGLPGASEIDHPARIPHEITETHRSGFGPGIRRIAGAIGKRAGAGHHCRRGGPDDGRRIRLRPADEEWCRTGGGRSQRRRRRARQEAGAAGRRRCLRSQAGTLGRREVREFQGSVRRRPLLFVIVDPGLRGLCRRQRAADYAGLDQPALHRAQALERGARLRPRRPAGPGRRRVHPEELQGQERRHPQRQDHLRQGSGRRDQEGAEQGRLHREDVRILQQGRQGF